MSPDPSTPSLLSSPLVPMAVVTLIFYFLVFRPQIQKQNQQKLTVKNVKKNDQVVTIGGIHGTVVTVKETTVIVRIDENVKVEVNKEAIASVKSAA